MRSARPPLWRRMRRFRPLVVFALALPAFLYGLVGPDPLAHDVTPHPDVTWDGDPHHGTVKVSKTQSGDGVDRISFTINEGQSVSYYFKATHPPGGTNWFIQIIVDDVNRHSGTYKGLTWAPAICKIWPHLTAVLNLSDRNSDFI